MEKVNNIYEYVKYSFVYYSLFNFVDIVKHFYYNLIKRDDKILELVHKVFKNAYYKENWKKMLSKWYYINCKRHLNLDNPQTYTEKMQWIKIYDNQKIKSDLTDKLKVKEIIKNRVGDGYTAKVLAVYDSADEIDFDSIPNKSVIKPNNWCRRNFYKFEDRFYSSPNRDSGVCGIEDIKKTLNFCMTHNYAFMSGYELNYLKIKPKIILEEYLGPEDFKNNIENVNIYYGNGSLKHIGVKFFNNYYSYMLEGAENFDKQIDQIDNNWFKNYVYNNSSIFKNMLGFCDNFVNDFLFVRCDFRIVDNRFVFEEFTFVPVSGILSYDYNYDSDLKISNFVDLPN